MVLTMGSTSSYGLCAVTRCDVQRASQSTSHDKPNLRSSTFSSSSRWSKASSAASSRGLIRDQDRKAKAGEPFVATDNNEYNALDKADCRGPEAVPATLSEWATIRPGRPIFRQRDSSRTAV